MDGLSQPHLGTGRRPCECQNCYFEYFNKANLPIPTAVQEFCQSSPSNDASSSDSEAEDDSAQVVIDPESESDPEDHLDPSDPLTFFYRDENDPLVSATVSDDPLHPNSVLTQRRTMRRPVA